MTLVVCCCINVSFVNLRFTKHSRYRDAFLFHSFSVITVMRDVAVPLRELIKGKFVLLSISAISCIICILRDTYYYLHTFF